MSNTISLLLSNLNIPPERLRILKPSYLWTPYTNETTLEYIFTHFNGEYLYYTEGRDCTVVVSPKYLLRLIKKGYLEIMMEG